MKPYKHLSYDDRKNIEDGLNDNKSINQIAKELNRNHSTILREIDRNKKYSEPSSWNNYKINHPDMDLSCDRLKHSPYVCNACSSRKGCRKTRYYYYTEDAQGKYEKLRSDSRKGIDMTSTEFKHLNNTMSNQIRNGHSFDMIIRNHKDEFTIGKRTLFNYVQNDYLDIINLDLPRKVRYKKRKHNKAISKI